MVLLGVVLPLVVLALVYGALSRPGQTHGHARAFDEVLAQQSPEIVILGSSLAHRGIDTTALARELGVPPQRVASLHLPHAAAAHWYAIAKNRVFDAGYRPRLIIVAGAMTTMLNHDLLTYQANVDRLVEQLSEDEPVLGQRVFGFEDGQGFTSWFLRERASSWRSEILEGIRDRVVTWGFTRKGKLAEGRELAERVNEEVFSNARMDYELYVDAPTGVLAPQHFASLSGEGFDLRAHGLIGDLQALCDAHDARLVYVRMPFPPSNTRMDEVPADIEREALAWMDEVGSGFLDMRTLNLTDADFEDMRHLTRHGALVFTAALARALDALGALHPGSGLGVVRGMGDVAGPIYAGDLPELTQPVGTGCHRRAAAGMLQDWMAPDAASLVALGGLPFEVVAGDRALVPGPVNPGDCSGTWTIRDGVLAVAPPSPDADVAVRWRIPQAGASRGSEPVWVLPGTTLRYEVAEAWSLPGKLFRVAARGRALPGAPGQAVVTVGNAHLTLDEEAGRVSTTGALPPPDGPWSLDVRVPQGAPALLLHHLAVGVPPTTTALLGTPETLHGASVRFVGGRLDDTRSDASYAALPSMQPFTPKLKRGPRKLAVIPLPKLADLADSPDKDNSGRPNDCSPLRVLEDGVPLPEPHASCQEALTERQGRACHAGNALWFSATDDTDPMTNGRTYTLALAPQRACATWSQRGATTLRGSWWLYPGDDVRIRIPPKRMGVFRDGPNVLEIESIPHVADPDVALEIGLWADGEQVLQTTWLPPAGTRKQRQKRFVLPQPLAPDVQDVVLSVRNPSEHTFHLLSMASLAEDYGQGAEAPAPATQVVEAARRDGRAWAPNAWRREGTPWPVPRPEVTGTASQDAVEAKLFAMYPVSNSALEKLGLGPWSPLRLSADGVPLVPIGAQRLFKAGCEACFLHLGGSLVYRAPAGAQATLEASLEPAVPLMLSEGREAWWVYPEGRLVLSRTSPWKGAARVAVRVVAMHPKREGVGEGLTIQVGEHTAALVEGAEQGVFVADLPLPGPVSGPWEVVIANGSSRGFALVQDLVVTDADGPAVMLPRRPGAQERGGEQGTTPVRDPAR